LEIAFLVIHPLFKMGSLDIGRGLFSDFGFME
jgi:hypothetical protein